MTIDRRAQLKKLMEIKENKQDDKKRRLVHFSLDVKMPHERRVEIGERILKEKFLIK